MVSLTSAAVIAAVALLSPLIVRLARLPVPEIVLQAILREHGIDPGDDPAKRPRDWTFAAGARKTAARCAGLA